MGANPVVETRLRGVFDAQRRAYDEERFPAASVREARLAALERMLRENAPAFAASIREDFGNRSAHETQLLEIFPALEQIRYVRRHLRAWMREEPRAVSRWFLPARASVLYQPLGVAGIIVPWNYPVYLAAGPLAAALAAGNRAMLKLSELTPRTCALFAAATAKVFPPEEVAVIEGDAAMGEAFARLPFDHLLFTGSTRVGHAVMHAAADNLTPVTLELGGKSPAILGEGFPLARAASRIVLGKCLNAGQTCIAPDYVLLPAGSEAGFVREARAAVARMYPRLADTPDYTSIVSRGHFERLAGYLEEARSRGAEVVSLSDSLRAPDPASRRIPPCAVLGAPADCALMREEIFGPILPLVPCASLDEAIRRVNAGPRPLALYLFENDAGRIDRVLRQTVAGGVTVNDTILHIAQDDLPFGGVGASGMGAYHGREGFETFSRKKAVFRQARFNGAGLLCPPYGRRFEWLLRLLLR
ncbi:MAG: coniferyl aldehyde dehydrogenase [Rhodocyclaceae bacterium]